MAKRLAPVLAAGLAALAPSGAAADARVFACEPEWAALAGEIGGDDVTVYSATHGRQDAHYIRARPSLIAQVRRADIVFCSGAELEIGWLPVLMERGARLGVQPGQLGHLMAADHVEVMERPERVDRSLGDIHPSGNPHVHLDPGNIGLLAVELAGRLARVDPGNGEAYRSRLKDFQTRWAAATERWRARAEGLRGMKVVVHHAAWTYLIRWTGLERIATLERTPGIPPTASHLQRLVERVRKTGAAAILHAPHEPRDAAEWLSERTGVPVVALPYTVGGQDEAGDLFALFEVTLALLEK
ncbi:MAG: zinc ABC transporter substrate-binding protein, partial [Defluviicoccus sp.]|nr:zinc ABC transporter substrate-binding protein [Defluviicoccus sp.]